MAKRLSEEDKKKIIKGFSEGKTIDYLSNKYNCSKLTISRNLKKALGETKYKDFVIKNKSLKIINSNKDKFSKDKKNQLKKEIGLEFSNSHKITNNNFDEDFSPFTELTPLDYEIENVPQKDFSSIPISEINFPKIVFMIINNNVELETKYLKDYPEWQFLSANDLERKTIQIFMDQKIAKRFCNKDQKVIKVPNPDVFRIASPILISRGISRIISDDKLISL